MGFFLTEAEAKRVSEKPKRLGPKKAAASFDPELRGCEHCPLKATWPTLTSPRMPMHGPKDADILILGEAPGEDEDLKGEPFVGKSGKFLRQHISSRHNDRLAWSNAVRCRPPNNRNPTAQEIHCCSVHLEEDMTERKFKAILIVGSIPLSKWIEPNEAFISDIAGVRFPIEMNGRPLWGFPIYHPSFLLHNKSGPENAIQYPSFQADIKRFFKLVDKWKPPVIEHPKLEDVHCVYTEEEAEELLARCKGLLGVDIETHMLRVYQKGSLLLTAAISDGDTTFAFPIGHPEAPNEWGMEFLLRVCATRPWAAHNAAFELLWLLFHGREFDEDYDVARYEDSMACARIYHERETLLALAIVSRIHLGVNIKKLSDLDTKNLINYPLSDVLPYNGLDAWGCVKIVKKLKDKVDAYNYEHILGAVRSTTEMELLGLPTDRERALAFKKQWGDIAEDFLQKARKLYEVKTFERERQQEFNIDAPEQVGIALVEYGNLVLPKTEGSEKEGSKKQVYSTTDAVLTPLAGENPLIDYVLGRREAKKLEGTYIDPVLEMPLLFVDGLLHPTYGTMFTATLRHSSSQPNIQNFPKRQHKELRSMIKPPPGYVWLACDMGQLEARVYAMITKDAMLCSSIIADEDIHTFWLTHILGEYPDYVDRLMDKTGQTEEKKIMKEGRNIIKGDFVFATFYGAIPETCADRTGIPLSLTKQFVDSFWGRYKGAYEWVKRQRIEYKETASARTLTDRVRYGTLDGNKIINTPIQATAADLVIDAQNELSAYARETGDWAIHPRINIHDDLGFFVRDEDDEIERCVKIIAESMTKVRFPWQIVPLTVEVQMGYDWAHLEEIAVIKGDYVRR